LFSENLVAFSLFENFIDCIGAGFMGFMEFMFIELLIPGLWDKFGGD